MVTAVELRGPRLARSVALAALVTVAACAPAQPGDPDALKVGLLLPYTGASAATSYNFERAILYARDQVNAGGGLEGRRIEVVAADTHSDEARASQGLGELITAGVRVVIGPESADIAAAMKPLIDAQGIVFLSPLVGAADDTTVDCTVPWFRLAPSARALGEALAKQARADGIASAALFHSEGAYDLALAAAFQNRFVSLGGTISLDALMPSEAQSYAGSIPAAELAGTDAVVLSTTPRSAALLVNELRVVEPAPPRWYLSPLLKTDELIENVAPGALEGAVGVTPKIFDDTADFPTDFAAHWGGDEPLDGAYFYYDAMALVAFGLERAALADPQLGAAAIRAGITASTGNRGEAGGWDQMAQSIQMLQQGIDMNYSGLTGPMLLEDCGDRRSGESTTWQIRAGRIQD
ncbi:MAG TPA: ABC transporter substrate-binding protein [Polyangia bacterium]|nr:ABC transporter substrate-binding protein [Polyangia bacterium]